jgi:hypothetical protein
MDGIDGAFSKYAIGEPMTGGKREGLGEQESYFGVALCRGG